MSKKKLVIDLGDGSHPAPTEEDLAKPARTGSVLSDPPAPEDLLIGLVDTPPRDEILRNSASQPYDPQLVLRTVDDYLHYKKLYQESGRAFLPAVVRGSTAERQFLVDIEQGYFEAKKPKEQPEEQKLKPNDDPISGSDSNRYSVLEKLQPSHRKAYLSFLYAESMNERRLQDRDAYDWLTENDIDTEIGELGELVDYSLPAYCNWSRYLRFARNATGEQKYEPRTKRKHPIEANRIKPD